MVLPTIPKDLRGLRACLMCSLIKSVDQFEKEGCDNCEEFLSMKDNIDNVVDCTSKNFEGMISMLTPGDSWVAKWQRINHFCKGVYAISVSGRLPNSIVRELRSRGIIYKSRDTSR
ncbi:transcription elongation factor subunit spt4 [Leptinotarsa decemlineata]|uniref:transcription elongation factor subunit spt4 n=1 Tax=Leptinotarsa decemlineata TaxID=7539 RepID=UPI000C254484|nr:transcription elongation factor SPT4-like [Leptinotarsa decemlineata]